MPRPRTIPTTEEVEPITLYLPKSVKKNLRKMAAERASSMSALVLEALKMVHGGFNDH